MSNASFPANAIEELAAACKRLPGIDSVVGRALRPLDPNATIGLYALDWAPGEYGIGAPPDPSFSTYSIHIMLLIKHLSEEEGRAQHSILTKSIRTMVYRDPTLLLRLPQLSETDRGVTEKVLRCRVKAQRFLSNEIMGDFMFLSLTEVILETENGLS